MSFRERIDYEEDKKNRYYKRTGKQQRVRINLDYAMGFFKANELNVHEKAYLLNKKYQIIYRTDLTGKKNYFLVKPRGNESAEHFLLVKLIEEYLKPHFKVWLYHSVKPDAEIKFKNRMIAMEIETGKLLRNNKKEFLEKVERLNDNYGKDWFFIVTNRNLLKKYRKYGKTYTRKSVLKRLNYYINNKPKESISMNYENKPIKRENKLPERKTGAYCFNIWGK
ncbi:MAG: hypothetical protein AABW80_05345 [Nanoarchaeota archaeon]